MNPGDTRSRQHTRRPECSLNEGRDVNPGDTRNAWSIPETTKSAQRRPGRESRRHRVTRRHAASLEDPLNEGRDVNPGDTWSRSASRRSAYALNEGRDVNPGDTLSPLPTRCGLCTLNEGRDVNPGDTRSAPSYPASRHSLNEGRDVNPGDTANCMQERHPGENCPVEWTVAVPQRCVCVQFNAPVERYSLRRSGSTRKHGLRRQRVACGRPESPGFARRIRAPKADRVRDSGVGRSGA